MNRKELNEIIERFNKKEARLKSLEIGQYIYEQELADPLGFSYFTHEVVSVDLDEMCVNTLDWSLGGIPKTLYCFDLPEEINSPKYPQKNEKNGQKNGRSSQA